MNDYQNYKPTRTLPIVGRQPPHISKRPRCPGCGAALRPLLHTRRTAAGITTNAVQERYWFGATEERDGHYDSYGAFHSRSCATDFANRVISSEFLQPSQLRTLIRRK